MKKEKYVMSIIFIHQATFEHIISFLKNELKRLTKQTN